jgi:hypothetical protein
MSGSTPPRDRRAGCTTVDDLDLDADPLRAAASSLRGLWWQIAHAFEQIVEGTAFGCGLQHHHRNAARA